MIDRATAWVLLVLLAFTAVCLAVSERIRLSHLRLQAETLLLNEPTAIRQSIGKLNKDWYVDPSTGRLNVKSLGRVVKATFVFDETIPVPQGDTPMLAIKDATSGMYVRRVGMALALDRGPPQTSSNRAEFYWKLTPPIQPKKKRNVALRMGGRREKDTYSMWNTANTSVGEGAFVTSTTDGFVQVTPLDVGPPPAILKIPQASLPRAYLAKIDATGWRARAPLLTSDGLLLTDTACTVRDSEGDLVPLKIDSLSRHPLGDDAGVCYFSHTATDGLMEASLGDCVRDSDVDDVDVIKKIGVKPVMGVNKCVVEFHNDLPAEDYAQYETNMVELAVARSQIYKSAVDAHVTAVKLADVIVTQDVKAVGQHKVQLELKGVSGGKTSLLTGKYGSLQQQLGVRDVKRAKLQAIIDAEIAATNILKNQYNVDNNERVRASNEEQRYINLTRDLNGRSASLQASIRASESQMQNHRAAIRGMPTKPCKDFDFGAPI